jgi:hypothetical protein
MMILDFGLEEEEVLWRHISYFSGEQGTSVQQPPVPAEGCAPIPSAAMARRFCLREMA